ncbi:MAG TPA: DUF4405 domain-containing protein [Candidatus Omnitrophota bacterium]|nr:DUF4405 domain-containing protein [Candidatus Omnitrophota bacterium]HRZ14603.1 DUF4405 domain-containing protein [Candidatus Omnitrophota bacterium]
MHTARWLGITNLVLFVCLLVQAGSGFLLLAADSGVLIRLHIVNAVVFSAVAGLHIALNWGWIRSRLNIPFAGGRRQDRRLS